MGLSIEGDLKRKMMADGIDEGGGCGVRTTFV
jgi:hypothetical protein